MRQVGNLLGQKLAVTNRLVTTKALSDLIERHHLGAVNNYRDLCPLRFANFGSIGIQIGGIRTALAPGGRKDLARMGTEAMLDDALTADGFASGLMIGAPSTRSG